MPPMPMLLLQVQVQLSVHCAEMAEICLLAADADVDLILIPSLSLSPEHYTLSSIIAPLSFPSLLIGISATVASSKTDLGK